MQYLPMSAEMIPSEIIDVVISGDGKSAVGISPSHRHCKFKIQDIMLGYGNMRMPVPWTKSFISPHAECRAEILENGKLRIV